MVTLSGEVVAVGVRAGQFYRQYETVAALLASTESFSVGEVVLAGPHRYEVAASDATDHHLTRSNGTKLYVLPGDAGEISVAAFGATGDGTVDATAAIQAAVDAAGTYRKAGTFPERREGGIVFFPEGQYVISSTISTPDNVIFRGAGQRSIIQGTVSGPLLYLEGGNGLRGVEHIALRNFSTDSDSWCIRLLNGVGGNSIHQVFITAGRNGIDISTSIFTTNINACLISGAGADTGTGILAGGHSTIDTCDITNFGKGVVTYGIGGVRVASCRMEANGVALTLGEDPSGNSSLSRTTSVIGCSFEANRIGIWARNFDGEIQNFQINGTIYDPPAPEDSEYGVLWESALGSMSNGQIGSGFKYAALRVQGTPTFVVFENVRTAPSAGVTGWDLACDLKKIRLLNCNNPTKISLADVEKYSDVGRITKIRSETVSVTEAATTVAIDLDPALNTGVYNIKAGLTTPAGGTLSAGTYYYRSAPVLADGVRGLNGTERSATIAVDGSIEMAMNTISPLVAYRIYRGTSPGVYDGFFDHDGQGNFIDSGQAFDGTALPAANATFGTMDEPDTDYQVSVSPSWETTAWVTSKATTGFTINFGTAAPAGATVDWILMR